MTFKLTLIALLAWLHWPAGTATTAQEPPKQATTRTAGDSAETKADQPFLDEDGAIYPQQVVQETVAHNINTGKTLEEARNRQQNVLKRAQERQAKESKEKQLTDEEIRGELELMEEAERKSAAARQAVETETSEEDDPN